MNGAHIEFLFIRTKTSAVLQWPDSYVKHDVMCNSIFLSAMFSDLCTNKYKVTIPWSSFLDTLHIHMHTYKATTINIINK